MWTYPRALKPDWSRWACCLFGLKPSWGLQDCPLPLTQSSGFRTLLGILKDSIMMWKRFPFIDIYERGKGAIVFTWNPQIYQWHLFRQKKKKIQVSTPLKCCQWIVGGLVFDEGLVFLPTNFVIVIFMQFCVFQKQKTPFFFSFTPPEFTASVTAENTLFLLLLLTKVDESVSVTVLLSHFHSFKSCRRTSEVEDLVCKGFFGFFLLFKTASVFFLTLTSCITLVYADWARSAPVPSVKGLKALAQSSPATSLCLFSIVFCSVNICPLSSRSFL